MEYIHGYNKNTYAPRRILVPAAEYTYNILGYHPQCMNTCLKPPLFLGAANSFNASSKSHTSNKWLKVQM